MATCKRCRNKIDLLGSLLGFNWRTGRCGDCESQVKQQLHLLRQKLNALYEDEVLLERDLKQLQNSAAQEQLDWEEVVRSTKKDNLSFLLRILASFSSEEPIAEDREDRFRYLCQQLLPPTEIAAIFEQLDLFKSVAEIRQGNLPIVNTKTRLDHGEICHLETLATYRKTSRTQTRYIEGRLVATNQRLLFLSDEGGWEIAWKKVASTAKDENGIHINLSVAKGNGYYYVPCSPLVEATINTLALATKKQVNGESHRRPIPDNVKIFVWQRDGGRCVRCGSQENLEFDHIIPISKGGSNTARNLQLLCEKCNRSKGRNIV